MHELSTAHMKEVQTKVPQLLAERLHDPDIDKREYISVAIAMGKLGDATVVPKLIEMLSDTSYRYRWVVEYSQWGEIGSLVGALGNTTLIPELEKIRKEMRGSYRSDERRMQGAIDNAIRTIKRRIHDEDHSRPE